MLDRKGVRVRDERPARKLPLDDAEAKRLLATVTEVRIARGKKIASHPTDQVVPDMIKGPTGNVRAPLLVFGKKMLVGYSAETLEEWFG